MSSETVITHGFGVPNTPMPHQFVVRIPSGRTEQIEIWEDFGVSTEDVSYSKICRVLIPRNVWREISDGVKAHMNSRLKAKGIKGSRFSVGDNRVERILGRELCVLAWAIEGAGPDEAKRALTRWASYRPEEHWWLFQQIDRDSGEWDGPGTGWRTAIRHALMHAGDEKTEPRRKRGTRSSSDEEPNLFSLISTN